MPTLTAPRIDLDAAGLRLVAEVEAYLRSLPAPAARSAGSPLDLIRQAVPPVCRYGSTVQAWDAGVDLPAPTVLDRLRGRQPRADVTPAQHLRLVSRYLTAYGWCQGTLWDAQGRRCLLGAQLAVLQAGFGTSDTVMRARARLMEQLRPQMPGLRSLDQWNDAEGRTAGEVHRQLDIAAARAR